MEAGGLGRSEELTARAKTCIWQYIGQLLEREKALIQQQAARESISMKKQLSLPPLFANILSAENLSKVEHCSSEETDASSAMGKGRCQGNIPSVQGFVTKTCYQEGTRSLKKMADETGGRQALNNLRMRVFCEGVRRSCCNLEKCWMCSLPSQLSSSRTQSMQKRPYLSDLYLYMNLQFLSYGRVALQ